VTGVQSLFFKNAREITHLPYLFKLQ